MKAPVGLLSDRTVLHSKMEGLCPDKFAFVERSGTMKAPVGPLSDRTVLHSKMEGLCPDKFAFVERSRTMKAPVGLLSDRTVLRSKMEGLCPDKFQFAVLVPSRVWGRHAPTRKLSRRGTTFSRIENLRPRVAAPSSSSPLPPQAAVVAVAVPKRSFFFYPSTLRLYSSTILACGSSYKQKPPRRPELPVPAGRLFAFMKRRKTLRGLRRWSG